MYLPVRMQVDFSVGQLSNCVCLPEFSTTSTPPEATSLVQVQGDPSVAKQPMERICSAFKSVSRKKNKIHVRPSREEESNGGRDSSQLRDKAETQKEELDANESRICARNLRNLREGNSPALVQVSMVNLCALAETKAAGIVRAICKYRQSIHKISPKHRLRINQVLQAVISSASTLDYKLAQVIIKLAAEDMLRTTDLQDLYQDAAGDILVALWKHFPAEVLVKLLEGFQGQLVPYRSILCVLGKLATKAFTESDTTKIDLWERKLVEFVERLLIDVTDKACCEELCQELAKAEPTGSSPEMVFLYQYYGAILRTSEDSQLVQEQLCKILALSHKQPSEAKGIASAVGLAAARHLDEVFKALEDFSKGDDVQEDSEAKASQGYKWNTLLLCYGRVALGVKDELLPRVEFILAKMIACFTVNPGDTNLKKSFLIAVLMFLEAIAATGKAQGMQLRMKAPLVECLIVLIEQEPTHLLANTVLQDAMYIIKELSKLKPLLETEKKSSLLRTSFRSLFCLAPLESLSGKPCMDEQAADVQELYQQTMNSLQEMLQSLLLENPRPSELRNMLELMEPWMASQLDHERGRAVEAAMRLLKFVAGYVHLDLSREFSQLAHLTAVLLALCNDSVLHIRSFAVQGVSCLYGVLLHQKGLRKSKQQRWKWSVKRSSKPLEAECAALVTLDGTWHLAMHPEDQLFTAQLTSLLLSVLNSLRGSDAAQLRAAEEVLYAVLQNHAAKVDKVKDIIGVIYMCLQVRQSSYWSRKVVLRALTLLLPDHMEEVMRSCLAFSIPVDRHANELWTAMASSPQVAVQVLQLLLRTLQVKEPLAGDEESAPLSLAAMNVLYETFSIPEYRMALVEMRLQLFIPLLRQVLYVMQLELPEPLQARQDLVLRGDPAALSFRSTSIEIVKNLLSVAGDWEVYAYIEFQQGWEVLSKPHSFLRGTRLLARAMTECDSPQIPGIFGEAALILHSEEDELKKTTALALVIEFLKSPSAVKMMNRFSLRDHLEEGLAASDPVIRDLCQKGLSSFVFQQGKVKLLREQLPTLIDFLFAGHEENILDGLRDIAAAIYEMDGQGIGPLCVDLAVNIRSFFEDERAGVRASAITLFGQLVMRAKSMDKALLKTEVVYSLLPLLLHLKDMDTTVVMRCKLTLLHCGVFLGWAHLKLMFRSMAWDDIRSCLVNVWKYLMRNNHDNIHVFISQALGYLHHPQVEIRHTAARFTGQTLKYYSSELSKNLEQEDITCLNNVFQEMESSSDPIIANLAKTHRVVLQKLSVKRKLAGAGDKDAQVPDSCLGGHELGEWEERAFSPRLPPPPPESPLPEGSPMLPGSDFLGAQTPRRVRRTLAQRGTPRSPDARERERQPAAEASGQPHSPPARRPHLGPAAP
ncbi:maestro heat-like repeat family member 5 [Tiliqua scincoides]|uniref:maestro heat-like repeat family member 5 n=1 Tax=Tiliqua scincoides TaxID=71010 RepID=UPI00346311B8